MNKKFTTAAREAATKKGRLSKSQKSILSRLAKQMDTDIAGVKKAINKQVADEAKPKTKLKSKPKTSKPKRTPAENRELQRLIRQQKKDDAPASAVKEPTRIKLTAGGSEVLPSKVKLPEKVSKARRRELIETGQAKQIRNKKGKSVLAETGKYAPPASQIAEEMGIGASRGVRPTEKELRDMGGFEIRKSGGKVRGCGAAKKGFGKANYSYKNI